MKETFIDGVLHEIGLTTQVVAAIIIAVFAAAVVYLNKVKNGEQFRLFTFVTNMAVALVVAFGVDAGFQYLTAGATDPNLEKALMVFVGISASKIIEIVEKQGKRFLEKKAEKIVDNA